MDGARSVQFVDARSGREARPFADTTLIASSAPLAWPGIVVATGRHNRWCVAETFVSMHCLAINLDVAPLALTVTDERQHRRVVLDPGALWLCPAGEAFAHCTLTSSTFGLVLLDPARVLRSSGVAMKLGRRYGLRDRTLEHVVRALVTEMEQGGENGPAFADAMATALAVQLARLSGERVEGAGPGALAMPRLRRVLDLIESRLEDGVLLQEMARVAGQSPYHFARAFKRATGKPPHRYLLERRLERARAAVERGHEPLGVIAARFGFADQSHFTRLFKRRYGVTPGSLMP